nr:hypothetical protein [Candidatus Sigynarchaeota archaeon]
MTEMRNTAGTEPARPAPVDAGKAGEKKVDKRKNRETEAGRKLKPFYQLTNIIHRYRIYALFKHVPHSLVAGLAHFLARVFFGRSKFLVNRMQACICAITGRDYPRKFLWKLADANIKNMGTLLFDVMLKGPNYDASNYTKLVRFHGIEHLDAALKLGKGVLMPSLHVGEFFHCVAGLVFKGYDVAVVGNMDNRLIFEQMLKRPQYKTMHLIAREKYEAIHDDMVRYLGNNHIVFLMHDLAKRTNLRTPLVRGKRDVLVATPQSVVALHLETGAPIVPVVAVPDGTFTRSIVTFPDPAGIRAASEEARTKPASETHGRISTAINENLFPYVISYPHCHEELTMTGNLLLNVKIHLPAGSTLVDVIEHSSNVIDEIIKGSYEPGRADGALLGWLADGWQKGKEALAAEKRAVVAKKSVISLGGLETYPQISKMLGVIGKLCRAGGRGDLAEFYVKRGGEVSRFFHQR